MKSLWHWLSSRDKILLVPVAAALLVLTFYYFHTGQWERYRSIQTALTEKKKQLERAKMEAASLAEYEKTYNRFKISLGELADISNSDAFIGTVMVRLGEAAEENRVRIIRFIPSPPSDKGDYWEMGALVEAQGSFGDLARFLEGVEGISPSLVIRDLRLGDLSFLMEGTTKEAENPAAMMAELTVILFTADSQMVLGNFMD